MGLYNLGERSGPQLVTIQVVSEYRTKKAQLVKYLHKVRDLAMKFNFF